MSWIKPSFLIILIISFCFILLSWVTKNFGYLLIAITIFLLIFPVFFRRYENITIPLLALLFGISCAELFLPYVTNSQGLKVSYYDEEHKYKKQYSERINGLGYRPIPGVYRSSKVTSNGEIIYDVIYTIGKDGYRLSPYYQRPSVHIYGGSFTFGEGLNDNETLTHYMWVNHGIAAKSVSAQGYGLHQALFNIENGITTHNGFNILFTAPWHSLRSACKPSYAAGTPKYISENGYAKRVGICQNESFIWRVLSHSNIFQLLQRVFYNDENEITDNDIELYLAIVRSIARETHKSGSQLVISFTKTIDEQLKSTRWTNQTLSSELAKIADYFVDVTLAQDRESLEHKFYIHELDQHPSALANQERAKIIATSLLENTR